MSQVSRCPNQRCSTVERFAEMVLKNPKYVRREEFIEQVPVAVPGYQGCGGSVQQHNHHKTVTVTEGQE